MKKSTIKNIIAILLTLIILLLLIRVVVVLEHTKYIAVLSLIVNSVLLVFALVGIYSWIRNELK